MGIGGIRGLLRSVGGVMGVLGLSGGLGPSGV